MKFLILFFLLVSNSINAQNLNINFNTSNYFMNFSQSVFEFENDLHIKFIKKTNDQKYFTLSQGQTNIYLHKFLADGSIDNSFTFNNLDQNNLIYYNSYATGLEVLDDNSVLFFGENSLLHLDSYGNIINNFSNLNIVGSIYRVVKTQDGKLLVGGNFNIGGVSNIGIFRIYLDGTIDNSFQTYSINSDDYVNDILVFPNNKILVSGNLENINGHFSKGLFKLNENGNIETNFSCVDGIENFGYLNIFSKNENEIFVCGQFNTFNTFESKTIIKLNSDGTINTNFVSPFNNISGFVSKSIVFNDNNTLYVCGESNTNLNNSGVFLLNENGTINYNFDTQIGFNILNPNNIATAAVYSMIQFDNQLVIGGRFSTYNNVDKMNFLNLVLNSNEIIEYNVYKDIIYPNPSENKLYFINNNQNYNLLINIYDNNFKKYNSYFIEDFSKNSIDITNLTNGIYYVEIYNLNLNIKTIDKFVKN